MQAYLDHAATTPLRPEALAAMLPFLGEHFGNPSGAHAASRRARRALDEARDEVACCLGCESGEVVFTSGGTESDNLAVLGAAAAIGPGGAAGSTGGLGSVPARGAVVCSAVEHHAVRNAAASVGGIEVPVDAAGVVDLEALAACLGPHVALVSVMLVNNEVGTVEPLGEVGRVVRAGAPRALLHTDAVAAVGWRDVAGEAAGADLVSISAHKFGGPKGTGALVVRHGTRLAPVLHGGPQERGRRPGTPDVAGAVGMAAALSAATAERAASVARVGALRDRLLGGLVASVDRLVPTTARPGLGAGAETAAYSCHVCIDGVDNEELVVLLDDAGVCASAGAACASGALEASHVLSAMGVDAPTARSALRLSLGYCSTDDDVEVVLAVLPKVVEQLRS